MNCKHQIQHKVTNVVNAAACTLVINEAEFSLLLDQFLVLLNRDSDGLDVQIFHNWFLSSRMMRTTQSGLTVASFRMAVDRDNVGQDGRRATDWLNFVAWRKTAEFVCQYFRKGSTALVECQCQTRSYEDKNGQKRTATEFVVQKIHFCGPKTEQRVDDGGEAPPPGYQQPPYQNQQTQQMGFNTQSQRQQWQQSAPSGQQSGYSQGNPDDFSEIDDTDDLPF